MYLLIKEGLVYILIERQFSKVFFPQNLLKIMIYTYMYKYTGTYTKFLYIHIYRSPLNLSYLGTSIDLYEM